MRRVTFPVIFLTLACIVTWPLVTQLTTRLGAPDGQGDPFLNLWILGWDLKTISLHPSWLLNGRVFNANIFYPATGTLAYSDHQLVQALGVWPLYALTGNLVLCYNVVLILSLAASAWTMYAFMRSVTGSTAAAFAAGLIWGFGPLHFAHLLRIQLQALYWMPLTFLMLHRLIAGRRKRDAVGLGVVVALQAMSSAYFAVIGGIGLIVGAIVVIARARARDRKLIARLVLAGLVTVVIAGPSFWPYWRLQQSEGMSRTLIEAEHGSATPPSYLHAPVANLVYGRTGWLRPAADADDPLKQYETTERDLFPGLIATGLAILGLFHARRLNLGLLASSLAAIALVGFLLSLGPLGIRPLYAALYEWVFGFQAVRVPARFSMLVFFAIAGLAGIGIESLVRRANGIGAKLAVVAVTLVVVESLNGPIAYAHAPRLTTAVGQWLRDAQEPGPVLYLPVGHDREDALAMLDSLEHGRPIVNGHSGLRSALYVTIVDQLASFPDAIALLTLHDLGVRFVVAPSPLPQPAGASPIVERARFDEGTIYELRWTPELEASLDEVNHVVPPPAGALPLGQNERTIYDVRWVGGPMTIPAGQATIAAERESATGFRFSVRATTAPWMRAFFAADDELETRTDEQFLSRVYRESLNEGARHQRRIVEFDRNAKRVKVTNGDTPPVTLPLDPQARDPIAALFYIRSLPLAEGYEARVPVSDAGRSTIVSVKVLGSESISIGGRQYDTWKVEPTFATRLAWSEQMRATVWVSRDERKLPLLIRVSAGFGNVDVELAEH